MQRASKKRDAIYAALMESKSHPTAEWIYRELKPDIPELSLGTVYANLSLFRKEGKAVSVAVVEGKERFDGDLTPHAHFICRCCGRVADVFAAASPEDPALPGIAESCQTTWHGICYDCCRCGAASRDK
ncbi:MAG: transcriptional repressor [Oscillospiraceae bacterium]|jgi:Fur family peroxide stress response transcriptional regulator|nr:transcriptional repressor [Oscillospiraceae bacterium]